MIIHVVQPDETIDSIADSYQISVYQLIRDNGLNNAYNLVPGQTIVIAYPELTYTIHEGDTLDGIAQVHGITVMQILRNNPFLSGRDYIIPGDTIIISYNTQGSIATNGFCYPFIDKDLLRKTLPNLTYLSVFNYRATREGEITTYYDDTEIIQLAKDYAVAPLIMLTTLSSQGEPDLEIAYELLLNEDYQNRQIENMLSIIHSRGYMGINIVFYFMDISNQDLYRRFITKISERLRPEGLIVIVTINPNIENTGQNVVFNRNDYSIIGREADSLLFLQFIWGKRNGPPAPVISAVSLKAFIDYAIPMVPNEKFNIGIPTIAYNYTLTENPENSIAQSLTKEAAISLASSVSAAILFDEPSQTPYFYYYEYSIGYPVQHLVWFIDARTYQALLSLVSDYSLIGIGVWSIMIYDAQLWLIINSQYDIIKILPYS